MAEQTGPAPADLIRSHQRGVWRYLRWLGCDETLAEDLTQSAFLALVRSGFREEAPSATAAWLRKTSRNLFIDALRRHRCAPPLVSLDEEGVAWVVSWRRLQAGGGGGLRCRRRLRRLR